MTETTQITGPGYLATLQGICKIVEAVASFIAVMLVAIDFRGRIVETFEAATIGSLIASVILLVLYIARVVEKIQVPWNKIQFVFHILWAVFYLVAAALLLDKARDFHYYVFQKYYDKIVAGGVFGIFATLAHIVDAVDNYKKQPLL